jgi:UDP-glucose 4-epimerase
VRDRASLQHRAATAERAVRKRRSRFVQAALVGTPLEVHGDGSHTRCFCHVADTVRALAALLAEPAAAGEIYNVGSTESVSILKLAKRVLRLTGSSSELVIIPYEQVYGHGIEEMFQRMPSIEKIQRAIGWRPQRELDEILADVVVHAPAQQASLDPI